MKTPIPNPGSEEAAALGCTCPRIDNGYGRRQGGFVYHMDCPVHVPEPAE